MKGYEMPAGIREKKDNISYGEQRKITYESTVTGCMRKANVFLPPGYHADQSYPIVYLLHGIGGDEEEWFLANPVEIWANLIKNGALSECILVFPNVRARKDDRNNPEDIFSLEHFHAFDAFLFDLEQCLMPYMKQHFSIKEGREYTAICGYSMGGRESLYIGCSRPEVFGYVGAFSPAVGVLPYENAFVKENGLLQEKQLKWPEDLKTHILIMTGEEDMVVREEPKRYHETLEKNHTKHIFYETPGGHDYDVWAHGLYHFLKEIF